MKKSIGTLLIAALVIFGGSRNLMAACGSLESTSLRLVLPCVGYAGKTYEVALEYYQNASDPSNLYWRFSSLRAGTAGGSCGSVDAELNISGVCVNYLGVQYTFNLNRYNNPGDPSGLYWKLQLATLGQLPGSIASVSGDDAVCYSMLQDPAQLAVISQCMATCTDLACFSGCYSIFNLAGAFSLGLTLTNPTSTPVEYTLPAGFIFSPGSSDVQPMLVLQDLILTIDPGTSTYCVPTYCLDVSLHAPGESDIYSPAPVASQQCLQDIIDYTKGKDLSGFAVTEVQSIIWDCMDTGTISNADRAFLQGL